ncbi:TAXI family TRAP transporter solute-binding subunit [Aquisalimonas sp.]|uniref:TAXI family TRAP transporter solute-binding subunit n=1 Tax=Aquisalimonas sp. TaxID=1872621 RepID=UPI0025C3CA1A|nr:TAXI family TRAP transporter solute-binding subunit [Aquisalimonas sp.]
MSISRKNLTAGALGAVLAWAGSAGADDIKLPGSIAMTAYGTGSAGYTQMAALGNHLQNNYGTSVRILPGENDVARMTPLKTGRVPLCSCGIASFYGAEGVFMFSGPDWGPQDIRVVGTSIANFGLGLAVAGDIGVETPADLEGKRIAYIRGDDALNVGAEAFLAFGGLTWDDVERVEFPGYGRSFEGIIANQADAAFTMTVAPPAQQLDASPRGITWPRLDPDDTEGWARFQEVAPYFQPHTVTLAAGGYDDDNPWVGSSYPYPILVANRDLDDETVRGLLRVLIEDNDQYKDAAPGLAGWSLDNQNMEWVIPFHDAVVEYYKEIGHWTDAMQEHQDMLVDRHRTIRIAWGQYVSDNPPSDEDAFKEGWMEARAAALEEKGMDPIFR